MSYEARFTVTSALLSRIEEIAALREKILSVAALGLALKSVNNRIPQFVDRREQELDMENPTPFNARLVSAPSERLYRIYLRGSDLYFIQLGGLNAAVEAVAFHFGAIGFLIVASLKKRAERKVVAAIQHMDQQEPEQLLREHKNNFRVYIPEIRASAIEPPAIFAIHGKQAGRWNFSLMDGKKMRLEFENSDEMKTALSLLQRLLNATLKANVEWNDTRKRFQKKKTPSLT